LKVVWGLYLLSKDEEDCWWEGEVKLFP